MGRVLRDGWVFYSFFLPEAHVCSAEVLAASGSSMRARPPPSPCPLVPHPTLGGGLTSFSRLDFQGFFGASVLARIVCGKLSLCRPLVREFEAAGGWKWHFCRVRLTVGASVRLKVLERLASPLALYLAMSTVKLGPLKQELQRRACRQGILGRWWWKPRLSLNETRFPLGIKSVGSKRHKLEFGKSVLKLSYLSLCFS